MKRMVSALPQICRTIEPLFVKYSIGEKQES
jgi:hypothetical protein